MSAVRRETTIEPTRVDEPDLPPRVPLPRALTALPFVISRRRTMAMAARRYGSVFTIDLPVFGRTVVVADPQLAKQVFTTPSDVLCNVQPNLSRILGEGSMFALEGDEHRSRRRLLTPPLHGKAIKVYEQIVAEEFAKESATWPEGEEIATVEPMMRVTLNVILRAVFGAQGEYFEALRRVIPPMVESGSRCATIPDSMQKGRIGPWARFRRLRAEYDSIIADMVTRARKDPDLQNRTDIMALMLQSTYDDGSAMTTKEVADELVTLLAAGHETTANTLAWAFERLSRHPELLARLTAEVDEGGSELRQATILEVQRSRPVIDFAGRHVLSPTYELGQWRIPKGSTVFICISLLHDDSDQFRDPEIFDPGRFVDRRPSAAWLPFGGGTRRCIGAAFANMEMDVVLRECLRDFEIVGTDADAERWHGRGVAYAPRRGGRMMIRRR
ncbi:cytochrome P450 [Williamsia sp.]|uniref:cytochrome P450 n=1 Tax=Williamsia sp. TaxID=1872085 RepID=UPI002F92FBC3